MKITMKEKLQTFLYIGEHFHYCRKTYGLLGAVKGMRHSVRAFIMTAMNYELHFGAPQHPPFQSNDLRGRVDALIDSFTWRKVR